MRTYRQSWWIYARAIYTRLIYFRSYLFWFFIKSSFYRVFFIVFRCAILRISIYTNMTIHSYLFAYLSYLVYLRCVGSCIFYYFFFFFVHIMFELCSFHSNFSFSICFCRYHIKFSHNIRIQKGWSSIRFKEHSPQLFARMVCCWFISSSSLWSSVCQRSLQWRGKYL